MKEATANESRMSDDPKPRRAEDESEDDRVEGGEDDASERSADKASIAAGRLSAARGEGGFFSVYKRGQGYWTRVLTACSVGLIILASGNFLYQQIAANLAREQAKYVFSGVVVFLVVMAAIAWRIINKPSIVEFLIATESEMKKVNWTTRKELMGSTKVVIAFMFIVAAVLFALDLVFSFAFAGIGVIPPNLRPF